MKKNVYNILLLSDLSESGEAALKSTVAMAKIIKADIHLFFVQKPINIIEKENQLSAQRTINETHFTTKKEIENFIAPYIKNYGVVIDYSFSYGNVKNEIKETIENQNPDIIILGKRKAKLFSFVGDNLASFVLKTYNGPVVIASETYGLEPDVAISLGALNSSLETTRNSEFIEALIKNSKRPLKSFRVSQPSTTSGVMNSLDEKETVEFVFEKGSKTLESLNKYLSINKINLLYIDRGQGNKNLRTINKGIKSVINKMDISLLVSSY